MNRVTIDFQSAEDLLQFTRLAAKAKLEEGTPGSLWVALACSALKRAKVMPTPEARCLVWAGQSCEIIEESAGAFKLRYSNATGTAEHWVSKGANLHKAKTT